MRNEPKVLAALVLVAFTSAACKRSIHKVTPISASSAAISIDAKQRFLITTTPHTKDAQGKAATQEIRKICLEPSPDVFSVVSAAFKGDAKYKEAVSVAFENAFTEAGATIGIRTQTIQLLRDAMYRICELALNGDLKSEDAAELHTNYQKSMVTLAAVSALADAAQPAQIALTGRATISNGTLMAELTESIKKETEAKKENETAVEAATAEQADVVDDMCGIKVKDDSCKDHARDCVPEESGAGTLCEVEIGGEQADSSQKRLDRALGYCENEEREEGTECKGLVSKNNETTAAKQNLKNAEDTIAKLQAEFAEAKKTSGPAAVTNVMRVDPAIVEPHRENIRQVACVVQYMVTQVYASDHLDHCLTLLDRNLKLAADKLEFQNANQGKAELVPFFQESDPRKQAALIPRADPAVAGLAATYTTLTEELEKGKALFDKICLNLAEFFKPAPPCSPVGEDGED